MEENAYQYNNHSLFGLKFTSIMKFDELQGILLNYLLQHRRIVFADLHRQHHQHHQLHQHRPIRESIRYREYHQRFYPEQIWTILLYCWLYSVRFWMFITHSWIRKVCQSWNVERQLWTPTHLFRKNIERDSKDLLSIITSIFEHTNLKPFYDKIKTRISDLFDWMKRIWFGSGAFVEWMQFHVNF